MKTPGLSSRLAQPAYYLGAIERLHCKLATQTPAMLHELQPEGYHFAQAYFDRKRLAKYLAQTVAAGEYRFGAATIRRMLAGGKLRNVYGYTLTDRIVHGAAFSMLAEDVIPQMHPRVFSYIKGRSKQQAIDGFTAYVRAHRRVRPDPKQRGLFVLRADIAAYGESIPVTENGPLWRMLEAALATAYGRAIMLQEKQFLHQLICPQILGDDGKHYQKMTGISVGSPVSVLLLNLYARAVDAALSGIEGGFYARYGDDMLFAHPELSQCQRAEKLLQERLQELSLMLNSTLSQTRFFNAAGRPSGDYRGIAQVEYLGCQIGFSGNVMLKSAKLRLFLHDVNLRIAAAANALSPLAFEEKGKALCAIVNDATDPAGEQAHPYALALRRLADDRGKLRQLDYQLARMVLRAMTGSDSVKSFRTLPYRKLRDEWQLRSLAYAKNR
jgi:hypothetical protein